MATTKKTPFDDLPSEQIRDRIVQAIQAGNYPDIAARFAGVPSKVFERWMAEGEKNDAPKELQDFRAAVEMASAQAEVRAIALIQQAASTGSWQAAAWFLERANPTKWAKIQRKEAMDVAEEDLEVSHVDDLAQRRAARRAAAEFDASSGRRSQPRRSGRNN